MLLTSFAVDSSWDLAAMPSRPEPRFSQQYVRYRRFVGHALRRVGVAEADLDDLCQEVFLVLLRNIRALTETDRLMAWLHQVARRVASNHRRGVLRRDRRHQAWSEPAEHEDPELLLARAEAAGFLAEFFDALDEDARSVFLLSEVEGMAGPAIAERLGLNINTTYSRIRSVRRRFREAVDQQRTAAPAWIVALPSLMGPSGWGPIAAIVTTLRMTTRQQALGVLTMLLAALALAITMRGSCSGEPQGSPVAPPILEPEHRDDGRPTSQEEAEAAAAAGRGGAVILGRVEDLDGAGVPSATVCLTHEPAATPRCTTTDDDGRYSFVGEPAGVVSVVASARGYVAAPAYEQRSFRRIRVPVTGTLRGVDLLLRPGGREVSGHVRDVVGGPIEGATVVILDETDTVAVSRTLSDEDGRFSLWVDATSFVRLRASAEGYVAQDAMAFRPAGPMFELVLFPEAVIEGRVVDAETGAGLADVVVEVQRGRHDEVHTARTDAAGRFRLSALRPGRYKPRVQDRAWLGHARHAVALELGETVGDVLIEAHGARQLAGRVQRPDGELCVHGRVTLRDASGEDVSTQRTDDAGEVRLGGLLPGEYTVAASCEHPRWARTVDTPIDLLDADVEGAVWEVPEPYQGERALRGRVVGPDGEPVAFASIEAVRDEVLDDGTMVGPTTLTDREGRFVIEAIPEGHYRISAEAEGFAHRSSTVDVSDRDVDVELELAAAAGLRIYTRDPQGAAVAGVQVKVAATFDRSGQWLTTNAEGWADASDLVPGTYRLVVSRPGVGGAAGPEDPSAEAAGTRVTVTGGGSSEITLTVPARDGSVRGRALRTDGDPVADAVVTVQSSWTYLSFVGEPRHAIVGQAHTDEEGRFVVEGLEAESFTVTVQDAFGQTASRDEVEPGASVVLELPSPGKLVGTVEIESEAPPEQLTVTVTPAKGRPLSETFLRTDGHWSIVGVPPGTARVEVSSAWGTAQAKAKVEAGREAAPITLRLAPRGRVRGRVIRTADGEPLVGVSVVVLSDHGPATGAIGKTRGDGAFELSNAPSGSVVIKVIAPVGYRPQRLPIEVRPGETVELGEVQLEPLAAAAP